MVCNHVEVPALNIVASYEQAEYKLNQYAHVSGIYEEGFGSLQSRKALKRDGIHGYGCIRIQYGYSIKANPCVLLLNII